jgi:hypothetical protein
MDHGRAYFFNLLTFPLELTLNSGAKRIIPPLSDGEPFTAWFLTAPRTFAADKPPDELGKQNTLRFGPVGGSPASSSFSVDPENWPVNQPVQVYLLADLVMVRAGAESNRPSVSSSFNPGTATSRTRRAFFFNMTGQSLRLVLNNGAPVMLPALPAAEPFTPPLTAFPRVDTASPAASAVFGITNSVQYWLAGSDLAPARRRMTIKVELAKWPLDNDLQVYLFQRLAVVRLGGNASSETASIG